MATKKQPEPVVEQAPQPVSYAAYNVNSINNIKNGKSKLLSLEYLFAMGLAVMSAILLGSVISAIFGLWTGGVSATTTSVSGWLAGFIGISTMTPATGVVAAAAAALLFALVSFVLFGRVSRTIPERAEYTSRTAYRIITYGGLAVLVVPALVLVAKIVAVLVSSLLMIGVDGAGAIYKSLYLSEFLPILLSLGVIAVSAWAILQIINGRNRSKLMTLVLISVSLAALVAAAITTAVRVHDNSSTRNYRSTTSNTVKNFLNSLEN